MGKWADWLGIALFVKQTSRQHIEVSHLFKSIKRFYCDQCLFHQSLLAELQD